MCLASRSLSGVGRLPVGIQLVGPRLSDFRLLGIAKTLAPVIDTDTKAALRELWN